MEATTFKKTVLWGNLRDRRFSVVLQQCLGRVAELLAKRLLISEEFVVGDLGLSVSRNIAGVRYAGGMGGRSGRSSREIGFRNDGCDLNA